MTEVCWVYYAQRYASGIHIVFREAAGRPDEVHHRQRGWVATTELFDRKRKGEIDRADLISCAQADELIRENAR